MSLSSDLISKFVKITRDDKRDKTETTVYGTIVESNGTKYVRFDGASENQLTPVDMTVDAKDGERVSVLLKDHNATVTGNLTSPAVRTETVQVVVERIETDSMAVEETLTAHDAELKKLRADMIDVEDLDAVHAKIEDLDADMLSATDARMYFATIDFANIGEAAIEHLFSESGIITDLVMKEGHVTGRLVGVTIVGDLIEGGTVKADKLVILGTDGLYYKLNTNGVTTTAQQTDYNSLNGKIITAKSITAEKVSVTDLVAFGATIGGFKITDDSLYSGTKASATSQALGIYFGKDGQFAVGDDENYIRFVKDANGHHKLEVAAENVHFGPGKKNLSETVDELKDEVTTNLRIESSRGTVFKNNAVSTVLSAVIYRGSQRITDINTLRAAIGSGAYLQWKWQRLDDETFGVISASDSRLSNDGFAFTITSEDVDTKVTFMCELIV